MHSSKDKVSIGMEVAKINGRAVLQPTCNRVPILDRNKSFTKISPNCPPPPPTNKRGSDPNALNSSSEKVAVVTSRTPRLERKKSKSFKETSTTGSGLLLSSCSAEASLIYSSALIVESPGSIAAVRREQMALQHAQRKMRIAHYGRSKSAKFEPNNHNTNNNNDNNNNNNTSVFGVDSSSGVVSNEEEKRCSFITPNSDPIYVAYHDEEWGVPVHDDKLLFELLVLSCAQVGSDWTAILKKRQDFRDAFWGFDAETVAKITEKQMISISTDYCIDISRVRGVVDNANRILQIKKEFGSFGKYIWAFVNNKPISTQYKFGHKIPVKTSKSETISKDMLRRGFRFVGPTMVHSFMQAAGLTNDHLITCHRHLPCSQMHERARQPEP